jgi:hypothetical protein
MPLSGSYLNRWKSILADLKIADVMPRAKNAQTAGRSDLPIFAHGQLLRLFFQPFFRNLK